MSGKHDSHERALKALASRGRLRALAPRAGVDFSSNDYLGLGSSDALRDALAAALDRGVSAGAGGSRLLRGNDPEHEALEAEAATFFGAESALYFGGGFLANYAIFSTLPQRGDLIVYDDLIHASAHDGMRASRAETIASKHNDPEAFEDVITAWRAAGHTGQIWIAVESLYSMEGDCAPLGDMVAIADRHDAILVIDEAHATGVYGPNGRGLGAAFEGRNNIISLHTCGKALGLMGALVLAPALYRDFLINRGRPFIYATAPSPLMAAGVRAALKLNAADPERPTKLSTLVSFAGAQLSSHCGVPLTGTQIQPVIVGSDARATALAASLQAKGFDVRAVRPPTVPEGTSRLRISLTLNATEDDVRRLVAALAEDLQRLAA
jgi:8-amino-7-oxononanoate synthase